MMLKHSMRRCISCCAVLVLDFLWSKSMLLNYLKFQTSCFLVKLLLWCRIVKKGGLNHFDNSSLFYTLARFQSTTCRKSDLRGLGLRLLEAEPLEHSHWKTSLSLLLVSSRQQLDESSVRWSVMTFYARSGKLLSWEESVVPL